MNKEEANVYLSQLLEPRFGSDNLTLVQEVDGKVVGFMSLTPVVDYKVMYDAFAMDEYEDIFNVDQSKYLLFWRMSNIC